MLNGWGYATRRARTEMMEEVVPPGAPTVESAGPALPALLTKMTPCLCTTCRGHRPLSLITDAAFPMHMGAVRDKPLKVCLYDSEFVEHSLKNESTATPFFMGYHWGSEDSLHNSFAPQNVRPVHRCLILQRYTCHIGLALDTHNPQSLFSAKINQLKEVCRSAEEATSLASWMKRPALGVAVASP